MSEFAVECAYNPCSCLVSGPVLGGEAYCSEFCRGAEDGIEVTACGCGHPQCDEP
ncbi:MAG TPA: hypothetical protein VGX91_06065 [Candidatus Cybelea sp.]|nr:hypothetical protein [Candidatus Cybelea sp.]